MSSKIHFYFDVRLEYYFFINGQKNGLSKSETFPEQENALNNVECDLKVFINQESLINSYSNSVSLKTILYMPFLYLFVIIYIEFN